MREGTAYQAAYRIVRPDGGIRYQHVTGHPVVSDAGELVEFIGAAMDMTEHWQATKELERASEALRELQVKMSRAAQVATVSELAASIAHEVNQPLSGIITNANTGLRMLAADPPNLDGARETSDERFAMATVPPMSSPGCALCSARRHSRWSRWI